MICDSLGNVKVPPVQDFTINARKLGYGLLTQCHLAGGYILKRKISPPPQPSCSSHARLRSSHARSVQAHSAHACLAHACLAHVSLSPRFARPTLCSCHALHSRTTHARGLHATVSQLGFPTHQHAPAPLAGGQLHASATCGRTQCRRHLRANDRTLPGVAGPHAGGGAEKHRVLGVLAHRTPVQWGRGSQIGWAFGVRGSGFGDRMGSKRYVY